MFTTLIVEDNESFRNALLAFLKNRFPSMQFETASDAPEAMERMAATRPRLIFMDIHLPGTNGLLLTRRIRDRCRSTVIVMMSHSDASEYRRAAFLHGADYFYSKDGLVIEDLLALVEKVVAAPDGAFRAVHGQARQPGGEGLPGWTPGGRIPDRFLQR